MSYRNPEDKVRYDKEYYLAHKEAAKKNAHARYEKNRESVIVKSKEYYEKNKKRHHELSSRYRADHPEQALAHAAIANAVSRGKITKPKACQQCGRETRIEAHHHNGYAVENRLDVEWLCRRCHMRRHHP